MKWSKRMLIAHSSARLLVASTGQGLIGQSILSGPAPAEQAICSHVARPFFGSVLQPDPLTDMLAILQSKTPTVTATATGAHSTMCSLQREAAPVTADETAITLADWARVDDRRVPTLAAAVASARETVTTSVLSVTTVAM